MSGDIIMTEELCRAKFEEWANNRNSDLLMWKKGPAEGKYKNPVVEKMWEAYQDAWNTRAEMEKSDGVEEVNQSSFRVTKINENPRSELGIYYEYVNVNDMIPDIDEPRVFLNSDKKFMGVGLHSSFPDAEWHRSISEKSDG